MESEEDIIHKKLSPMLIGKILSLLPTRDAVRTSVLSKRWFKNWTIITKMDIDDSIYCDESHPIQNCTRCKDECNWEFYVSDKVGFADLILCKECFISHHVLNNDGINLRPTDLREVKVGGGKKFGEHFIKFVYKALLLTQQNSPNSSMLERFSLVIINSHDVDHLNIWISHILKRGVKNLKIHSPFFKIPFYDSTSSYLLNSTLLEELELVLRRCTIINVHTNSVHFGHLKHLKLSGIFFDLSSDCFTLSLPSLKTFVIKNCDWSIGKELNVEASLLEIIFIHQDVTGLPVRSIKFNASCLKEFSYYGDGITHQINLLGCGFLSNASVKIILKECENIIPNTYCFAFQLFHHIHQVKCIKLEGSEVLPQSEVVYPVYAIPELANLIHLEIGLVSIEVVLGLLQRSPVLKTINLKKIRMFDKERLNLAVVPECLISALQTVIFEDVNGDEQELCLAEFFFDKCKMLKSMAFYVDPKLIKAESVINYIHKKDISRSFYEEVGQLTSSVKSFNSVNQISSHDTSYVGTNYNMDHLLHMFHHR